MANHLFTQTDDDILSCGESAFDTGETVASPNISTELVAGGTAGVTEQSVGIPAASTVAAVFMQSGAVR